MEKWQKDTNFPGYGASIRMSLHDVFACHNLETFEGPIFQAVSLTKASRKGGQAGRLEISGEETYRGLTLPLLKAVDYLKEKTKPAHKLKSLNQSLNPRFIASLAVVRAPLIGAYLHDGRTIMLAIPWVRVARVEPGTNDSGQSNVRYFDMVSSEYFPRYLKVLLRDSLELTQRMQDNAKVLYSGAGLLRESSVEPEPETYEIMEPIPSDYNEYLDRGMVGSLTRNPRSTEFALYPEFLKDVPEDTVFIMAWERAEAGDELGASDALSHPDPDA